MAKLKILVLFGGTSNAYLQSLQSAVSVLNALPEEQYEAIPVGITRRGRWLSFPGDYAEIAADCWDDNPDCAPAILSPDPAHGGILILEDETYTLKRVDVIFSLLHGRYGEDGSIQGLFELSHLPYIGNGILGSAVCRNKVFTHILLNAAGIRTPKWVSVSQRNLSRLERECAQAELALGFPVFVKPANSDSAMGTGIADTKEDLLRSVKRAFTQDNTVLIEQLVQGREFRLAVFGYDLPFASFIGELQRNGSSAPTLTIPAVIDDTTFAILREIALQAFCSLDCKGLALFDFYIANNGDILLGEVNTMPELSETAAYPALMDDLGMRYSYLLDKLIEQAMEHADRGF